MLPTDTCTNHWGASVLEEIFNNKEEDILSVGERNHRLSELDALSQEHNDDLGRKICCVANTDLSIITGFFFRQFFQKNGERNKTGKRVSDFPKINEEERMLPFETCNLALAPLGTSSSEAPFGNEEDIVLSLLESEVKGINS
ncbi:hypothetical protein CDAR_511471 [Caerostris darwini]|uniref:Uncharacterized protein n=1 Tax=Caerostris darwini TaxID=1538125 RepID=A0AAV4UDB9_9ARAC|nr:hypothetical protein CDAR_511471 [Caerostris darwini]